MLEKKLQEFESELSDLFRIPLVNNPATDAASELSFDDFLQRFAFLDNLLSLEAASQPESSDHFEELGKRLDTLKTAFHEWEATRMKYRTANGDNADLFDGQSICSDCTHTLLCKSDHDVMAVKKDGADARGRIGKYFGVFSCGVIVGVACVVMKLFGNNGGFGQYHQVFLVPPT